MMFCNNWLSTDGGLTCRTHARMDVLTTRPRVNKLTITDNIIFIGFHIPRHWSHDLETTDRRSPDTDLAISYTSSCIIMHVSCHFVASISAAAVDHASAAAHA
jgi:hypothetical protein